MNFCRVCSEDFNSLSAFDKHRVGRHEYLFSADRMDGRRCLAPSEMLELGMARNKSGRWVVEQMPQEALGRVAGRAASASAGNPSSPDPEALKSRSADA